MQVRTVDAVCSPHKGILHMLHLCWVYLFLRAGQKPHLGLRSSVWVSWAVFAGIPEMEHIFCLSDSDSEVTEARVVKWGFIRALASVVMKCRREIES